MDQKKKSGFECTGVTFEEATLSSLGLDPSKVSACNEDISAMRKDDDKRKDKENS